MFVPALGRWIQNDPIEFEAGDPNLYRFVRNNPANFTDPSGLQEKDPSEDDDDPRNPSGIFCAIPGSDNNSRVLVAPPSKATILKGIPFWKKGNPACQLSKEDVAKKYRFIEGGRAWSGVVHQTGYIGPNGCGPCVGLALIHRQPSNLGFVLHFSAESDVEAGLIKVGFLKPQPNLLATPFLPVKSLVALPDYHAVICGSLAPVPGSDLFKHCDEQRLHTLNDVVTICKRHRVPIKYFVPAPGFGVNIKGDVFWVTDPAVSEGDRYEK